jgi:glucose-1-phosphate adenylyltransferase
VLDDCVIMDYARLGRGSRLRRVIVDRHNCIEPGSEIGSDPELDARRYHVTRRAA